MKTKVRMNWHGSSGLICWKEGEEGYIEGVVADKDGHLRLAVVLGDRIATAKPSEVEVIQEYTSI